MPSQIFLYPFRDILIDLEIHSGLTFKQDGEFYNGKNEKVDLVITHNLRGLGFWTVRALKNIKHIHILHDIQLIHPSGLMIQNEEEKINNVFAKLYFNITKKILASPNFAISPSAWLLEEHIARGFFKKSKKIVLPNPAEISESTKSHDRADGQIKFLYVGEIEKHKGIFLLIEAFLQCRKYYENISLDVIGKGSGEADLPRIQGINYLGWKTKKEVASAMVSSDCLIVPSLCYENSPTVIYEAANSCLPVIASRIGGIGELAQLRQAEYLIAAAIGKDRPVPTHKFMQST